MSGIVTAAREAAGRSAVNVVGIVSADDLASLTRGVKELDIKKLTQFVRSNSLTSSPSPPSPPARETALSESSLPSVIASGPSNRTSSILGSSEEETTKAKEQLIKNAASAYLDHRNRSHTTTDAANHNQASSASSSPSEEAVLADITPEMRTLCFHACMNARAELLDEFHKEPHPPRPPHAPTSKRHRRRKPSNSSSAAAAAAKLLAGSSSSYASASSSAAPNTVFHVIRYPNGSSSGSSGVSAAGERGGVAAGAGCACASCSSNCSSNLSSNSNVHSLGSSSGVLQSAMIMKQPQMTTMAGPLSPIVLKRRVPLLSFSGPSSSSSPQSSSSTATSTSSPPSTAGAIMSSSAGSIATPIASRSPIIIPSIPLGSTGRRSASPSPPPEEEIVCRTCETPVKKSLLEAHSLVCEQLNTLDMEVLSAENGLWEVAAEADEAIVTSAPDVCMQPIKTLAQGAAEADLEGVLRLIDALRALPRTCCKRRAQMLDRIQALMERKIAACRKIIEIDTSTSTSPEGSKTPRLLRTCHSPLGMGPASVPVTSPDSSFALNTSAVDSPHTPSQGQTQAPQTPLGRPSTANSSVTPSDFSSPGAALRKSRSMSLPTSPRVGISFKDFEFLRPIMDGGFGKVYLVRKALTKDIYALKVMSKRSLQQKNEMWCAKAERDILADTENPFVVKLYYSFTSGDSVAIVMEYLPGGDLFEALQREIIMEESMVRFYAAEIVLALEYLHSRGVIHRDVKPDNLLIDSDGHLKLTDFGLSQKGLLKMQSQGLSSSGHGCRNCPLMMNTTENTIEAATSPRGFCKLPQPSAKKVSGSHEKTPPQPTDGLSPLRQRILSKGGGLLVPPSKVPRALGTPEYIAPEVLLGLPHDKEVDWWALGCVIYCLLFGFPPFAGEGIAEIFDNIISKRIEWPQEIASTISPEAKDIIDKLLALSPEKRLGAGGADEIKRHPFFKSINWETLRSTPAPYVPFPGGKAEWMEELKRVPPMATPASIAPSSEIEIDEFLWVNFASLGQKTRDVLKSGEYS